MSRTYKLIVLALLAVLIGAAFYLPANIVMPGAGEEELVTGTGENGERAPTASADEQFAPSVDPYRDYIVARDSNQPVVVKFYARW